MRKVVCKREGSGGLRGPAACLCGLVWASVGGKPAVRQGEERSGVVVRRVSSAE